MTQRQDEVVFQAGNGRGEWREVRIKVGETYRVEPSNPLKKKHRGRICTVIELTNSSGKDLDADVAIVRFADNNSRGKVPLSELFKVVEASRNEVVGRSRQPIPIGLNREQVIRAIADLDSGVSHSFGEPTGYELVFENKRYAPKAVVGLACKYLIGRVLEPNEFSGGEEEGQANGVLRRLGFAVERKDVEPSKSKNWTDKEVVAVVADYFDMLNAELFGNPYSKSEHLKALSPNLERRSKGSIEFKHQNVSGVLVELGLPYIEGYKPLVNYQRSLATAVEEFLEKSPGLLERLGDAPKINPPGDSLPIVRDWQSIVESPPDKIVAPKLAGKPWLTRRGCRIDFAERDAMNRHLGKLGEQLVVDLERRRLIAAGRDDLASQVLWASSEFGDGLGYDIRSFDELDDSELMLEVKTTGLGKFFPFYVTSNEVRCSEDVQDRYRLYRLFDFAKEPRLYILKGSLKESCKLDPVLFRAVL
jgi:hypothetical protein